MKIKKIVMENFRCYKDRQEIEFDIDGKITLVYGKAGSGKSSILQFINWMFYNIEPNNKTGILNNKALYNETKFDDLSNGQEFSVFGEIDFINDGTEFSLVKEIFYKKDFGRAARLGNDKYILNYKAENGSWVQYVDDINKKINEFAPKALSKYFFFSGEENIIDANERDLKEAIYNLFGLTKYQRALDHIGTASTSYTVLNKYHKERANLKPVVAKNTPAEYLKFMEAWDLKFRSAEKEYNKYTRRLENVDFLIGELNKEIALSTVDPESEKKKLDQNNITIKLLTESVESLKLSVGKTLARYTPYLILTEKTKFTKKVLEDSAKEEKTFDGLTKATLLDILNKGECVCGSKIGTHEAECINKIIKSMPPDSYNYTFNQFIKKNDIKNLEAKEGFYKLDEIISKIVSNNIQIDKLIDTNKDIAKELASSSVEEEREKGKKMLGYQQEKKDLLVKVNQAFSDKTRFAKNYAECQKRYRESYNYEYNKTEFDDKIDVIKTVKEIITRKLENGINETRKILEESIVEVYRKISTRHENLIGKKFIDNDFRLRKEYKTGGQEVIDVYSYIIGMIKALSKSADADKESEFPVVIDAPFSKTDSMQLSHVIEVIPSIVSQVAMFTFDVERIKSHADTSKIGKVWVINSNEDQTVSTITKGERL